MILFGPVFDLFVRKSWDLLLKFIGHRLVLPHVLKDLYRMRNVCNLNIIMLFNLFNINLRIQLNLIYMYQIRRTELVYPIQSQK